MATLFDDASLVMIPSGYKDDKLYSIKPTSGDGDFTFSRDGSGASPATRVNSAGLIEKGRTNLLVQSNSFDTTWLNSSSTETSGQSGYDGTNDAWLLSKSAASGRIQQSTSTSGVQTFSAYLKAGTYNWGLLLVTSTGGDRIAYFDLANGVVGTAFSSIDSNIESVGNGWYRCSITFNATTTSVRIYPALGDTDLGTSGSIYIQDAQLEKGLVATSYIETTTAAASAGILGDMPRLDYSGGASCPSLLLEPARTNLIANSEYIEDGNWVITDFSSGAGAPSATVNSQTSPEGLVNAYEIDFPETTGSEQSIIGYTYTSTIGTSYTHSVYLKGEENCTLILRGADNTESAINVTTDWQRFTVTAAASTTSSQLKVGLRPSQGSQTDACTVYVWGAQVEASSYVTSYVPTYGSATARAGDSCSKTGISSLIGQTEGTLFFELKDTNNFAGYLGVDNGSTGTRILVYGINDQKIYTQVRNSATVIFGASSSAISGGAKVAVAFNSSGSVFYVNGVQVSSGSGTTYTDLSQLTFNHSSQIGAKIKQTALFKTRLSNAELESLTTL